ncbi:hypothetical protein [Pseudaminobacter soli (ex Li et al. 2025)]|nr:hypothetical protein [Mesorhizobium soli]
MQNLSEEKSRHTAGPWPHNICSGDIVYGKGVNYDGFYLADASHGIPTFGSVADADPVTIRGQHVRVFNYPAQTEAIAAQLVHRWNAHSHLLAALKAMDAFWTEHHPEGPDGDPATLGGLVALTDDTLEVWRTIRAAIAKAEAR